MWWFFLRIVIRLCIDHTRKKQPQPGGQDIEMPDNADDPESLLIFKERDRLVRNALEHLPPRQRMVVILKYYEGLSYAEISQAVGTTIKAVERLLARARRTLTKLLSETGI